MHVRDQIVGAVVDLVKSALPAAGGRVYPHGKVEWDRRSVPFVVVTAGPTRVTTEPGTGDRIQNRETEITVSIHDSDVDEDGVEGSDGDYSVSLGRLSASVEAAMEELEDRIPIGQLEATGDTGVIDLELDGVGLSYGTAITYAVTYYTLKGNVLRLHVP